MNVCRRPHAQVPPLRPRKKVKRIAALKRHAESEPELPEGVTINEFAKSIDTTLTPEQQAYVESIKKKIKGGHRSPRCEYIFIFIRSLD